MPNKIIQKLILFLFIFNLTSNKSFGQKTDLIKIDFIKLDNSYLNWGESRLDNVLEYEYIDQDGIPFNLKIQKQIKLLTIKYSLRTGMSGNFRYKLLGFNNHWSRVSQKNEVSFFDLPHGQYSFIIQSYENLKISDQKQFKFELIEPANNDIFTNIFYLIFYTLILSIYYSYRSASLRKNQKILEQTVKERTAEIILQKDEISLQKSIAEERHKEITDSINYAKRIQLALLTSIEYWDSISPENFVLWQPKDVVSGDFHWAYQLTIGNKNLMTSQEIAIWCAADCTGHGVPGAFMSMLGMSFLNEIVVENINLKPADVLNKLRKKIISALEHGGKGNIEQKDGMDVALCVWHKETNMLEFAGANNPVWIIRPIKASKAHEIIELKANRMPVGYHYDDKDFTAQEFQLQKGDAIYLFTDGFVDQFGGPDGKKYKSKKFKEMLLTLQHLSMKDQALMINKEFNDWRGDNEQIDDLCLVGVKVVS